MAAYPITNPDSINLIEALNYVASGPTDIGQQLVGYNMYQDTLELNGNQQAPFANKQPPVTYLYQPPIDLSTATWIDAYTRQYTFQGAPIGYIPYALGQTITVTGVSPNEYDTPAGGYGQPVNDTVVVKCTEDYVIIRSATKSIANPGPGTGGRALFALMKTSFYGGGQADFRINTPANAQVSVDISNSLVGVTAQLEILNNTYAILWQDPDPFYLHSLQYRVELNRYKAVNIGTVANPVYDYKFDKIVSRELIYSDLSIGPPTRGIPLTWTITGGVPAAGSAGFYTVPVSDIYGIGGVGAAVDVDITNDTVAYSVGSTVTPTSPPYAGNYSVGEQVYVPGDLLGGVTPTNDLFLTVASIDNLPDISIGPSNTIFTTLYDQPDSGIYRYIVQIHVTDGVGVATPIYIKLGRCSLTAQVIKR